MQLDVCIIFFSTKLYFTSYSSFDSAFLTISLSTSSCSYIILPYLERIHWITSIILSYNMMTPSNGNIFHVTGYLCWEFIGPRWIPRTKASDAELWFFFYLSQNKRFGKQSSGWWFETLSRPSWRYCNEYQYCKYRTTIRHICQTVTVVDQSHQPYKAPVRHPTMLRAEQKCAQLHSERCTAGRTPVITGGTKSPPLQWNVCVLYGLIPNPPQLYLCAFPIWFRRLFEWGACQLIKKKTHYSSQYNRSLLDVYIIR